MCVCVPIVVRGCGGEGCLPVQLRPQSLYRWPAPSPLLRHSSAPIHTLIISLTFAPSPLSHALKPRVQCNLPPLQCTGTYSKMQSPAPPKLSTVALAGNPSGFQVSKIWWMPRRHLQVYVCISGGIYTVFDASVASEASGAVRLHVKLPKRLR